jgi:hypothetical protein
VHRSTLTKQEPDMTNFRATPKTIRPWASYLMASLSAAVALNMTFLPLATAAINAAAARPAPSKVEVRIAAEATATPRAASAAHTAAGIDHSVIAADAVAVGDLETVEMSIGAYDRAAELAAPR